MVKGELIDYLFDWCYTINKEGEIYSLYDETLQHQGTKIKERIDKHGYPIVNLSVSGANKTFLVHRLLALTFIPNLENKSQVNHKNGNKLDYALNNLEWNTPSENMQHAVDTGLNVPTFKPRQVIDTCTGKVYPSIKKAAVDSNISYNNLKKYLGGFVKNKTPLQYA